MPLPQVVLGPDVPELAPARVIAAMREAFEALGAGRAEQPPQATVLLPGGGDVITYPAALHDAGVFCLKVSPYLPRPDAPAVVTAWTLLLSTATGEPLLLVDSAGLTVARTAATSAVAVDLLARPEAGSLLVIGAGQVGRAHLEYVRTVRPFDDVRLYSRSGVPGKPGPLGARVVDDLPSALEAADVVCLCTSAAEPVVDLAGLAPGALVTSISTNAPMAHEVAPEALRACAVYCDYAPTATAMAGEMVLAARAGLWSPEELRGDLPGILTGAAPAPAGDRPVFFRSVGLGIEDAAVAGLLVGPSGPAGS